VEKDLDLVTQVCDHLSCDFFLSLPVIVCYFTVTFASSSLYHHFISSAGMNAVMWHDVLFFDKMQVRCKLVYWGEALKIARSHVVEIY
jgi:hypothetical protein